MTDQPTPQQVRRALPAPSAAPRSTSPRRPCCWPPAARTSTGCAPRPPGSATPGLVAAGRPGVVTYSPKVFIPLTRLCRDRCHYCTFVDDAGPAGATARRRTSPPTRSSTSPAQGAALGCKEALFTLGDRPEDRWPEARAWLDEQGYDSTLAYVRAMAIRVLEETGLLPHLNPGVMSWEEMNRLKPVAPSMGMMLETTSRRLFEDQGRGPLRLARQGPGGPAAGARGRRPAVDPVHHRAAGRHRRDADRAGRVDLRAARASPARYGARAGGHRPELPGQARHRDAARRRPRRSTSTSPRSRSPGSCSGPKVRVQAPPNLVDLDECRRAARRRRRRLGRRLAAHPRPREPRAALAVARAAARDHRRAPASSCGRG